MEKITKKKLIKKLGSFVSVNNLDHINQFVVTFENGEIFKSYDSIIGAYLYDENKYCFSDYYKYSNTTSKHRVRWCEIYSAEDIENGFKDGSILKIE